MFLLDNPDNLIALLPSAELGIMFVVGLTGGIATGKSSVAGIFCQLDVPIIDADKIAREVVDNNFCVHDQLRAAFGAEIFSSSGTVDRDRLSELVFSDSEKRRQLNEIVHPAVRWRMIMQVLWHLLTGKRYIIMDVPLLFETGSVLKLLSETIVVSCSRETQLKRLMLRNLQLSEASANLRIDAQLPMHTKVARATIVLDNEGGLDRLQEQVLSCHRTLNGCSWRIWRNRVLLWGGSLLLIYLTTQITIRFL